MQRYVGSFSRMYVYEHLRSCYGDELAKHLLWKLRGVHTERAQTIRGNRHCHLQKPATDYCRICWIFITNL